MFYHIDTVYIIMQSYEIKKCEDSFNTEFTEKSLNIFKLREY